MPGKAGGKSTAGTVRVEGGGEEAAAAWCCVRVAILYITSWCGRYVRVASSCGGCTSIQRGLVYAYLAPL